MNRKRIMGSRVVDLMTLITCLHITAATMLARSGVGKIRIIDFDQVSLSSLNVSWQS